MSDTPPPPSATELEALISRHIREHHRTHVRQPSRTNEPRKTFHQGDKEAAQAILVALDYLALIRERDEQAAELKSGKDELRRLMDSIWRAEYRHTAPNWQPLDDLPGMVSQIDNMYAGVRSQRDEARAANAELREALEPFAKVADRAAKGEIDLRNLAWLLLGIFDADDFLRARAVLAKGPDNDR